MVLGLLITMVVGFVTVRVVVLPLPDVAFVLVFLVAVVRADPLVRCRFAARYNFQPLAKPCFAYFFGSPGFLAIIFFS